MKPGQVCGQPAELLDIYPTLNALCGLPPRNDIDGHSLVPQLRDATSPRAWPAITTHNHDNHGVRSARWRYIRYADGSEELYNMREDPNEWHNLLAPTPAGVASTYRAKAAELARWLPKENLPPAPKSAARILTYDPETKETIWEGRPIKPGDPIPEL